jgi:hypothetical protein
MTQNGSESKVMEVTFHVSRADVEAALREQGLEVDEETLEMVRDYLAALAEKVARGMVPHTDWQWAAHERGMGERYSTARRKRTVCREPYAAVRYGALVPGTRREFSGRRFTQMNTDLKESARIRVR